MPAPITDETFADLNVPMEHDAPLGPLTWYGVGGTATRLARPESAAQLGALTARCHEQSIPLYILGSGANLLVADDVPGVVVKLDNPGFCQLDLQDSRVTVGAGFDLMKLVLATARHGLAGLEAVAGIPASVGGAVRMNAGGAYGDVGTTVARVQVMSATGQVYHRDREDLVFSYRHSNIEAPFILNVEFELEPSNPDDLMKRVKEIFFYKKSTQPMGANSSGCAFKNPEHDDRPAGQLIDTAGLKGFRIGQAWVSDVHANFICCEKNAAPHAAADIKAVIEHAHHTVLENFGVDLQREVVVWP